MVAVVLYPNNVSDRSSIGLKNKYEHEQVSALLYAMGDCADDILAVARIDENKATYEEVRTTLNSYFDVSRNLIVQYKEPDLKNDTNYLASQKMRSFKICTDLQKTVLFATESL